MSASAPENQPQTLAGQAPSAVPAATSYQQVPASQVQPQQELPTPQQQAQPVVYNSYNTPTYLHTQPGFVPTFTDLLPPPPKPDEEEEKARQDEAAAIAAAYRHKSRLQSTNIYNPSYALSLLSVAEFTITAIPHPFDVSEPHELQPALEEEFRSVLESICGVVSSEQGNRNETNNDVADNDATNSDSEASSSSTMPDKPQFVDGKWRIPLSAYQQLYAYLTNKKGRGRVEGIPDQQLKVASLGRQRMDRSYPSAEDLIDKGVPSGIAYALAPYQRGGVDFCLDRKGRALLADDMGLGKSIQSIATMSCYESDWPLLVLCPSSARYHWQAEFLQWLGKKSSINNSQNGTADHVDIDSSSSSTNAVDGDASLRPKKRHRASRTSSMKLMRKSEVHVLTSSNDDSFTKPDSKIRVLICSYGLVLNLVSKGKLVPGFFKAAIVDESHMLKDKSSKRTKVLVPVLKATKWCLMLSGTPALSKPRDLWPQLNTLGSNEGHGEDSPWWQDEETFLSNYVRGKNKRTQDKNFAQLHTLLTSTVMIRRTKSEMLKSLPPKERSQLCFTPTDAAILKEFEHCMQVMRKSKGALGKIARGGAESPEADEGVEGTDRKAGAAERRDVLNRMYSLTGQAKVPIVVSEIKRWLADPTKGKVCIFAHHIAVLDGIVSGAGLSNTENSMSKYIRIDGSTNPKARQEAITTFQNDPTVRIAILGITAASVAVTLTAASTVWFAELFWTPAIQIQAEDRCHRIGQQSIVRCVYFQAKGSLDDLLWKLLEQKYRDLGEFVEGEEGKEIKVHEISSYEEEESEEKKSDDLDAPRISAIEDEAIRNDIIALGMEEESMLKAGSDDGEDNDDCATNSSRQTSIGSQVSSVTPPPSVSSSGFDSAMPLPGMLLYKMDFARSFGFVIAPFEGRMVVKSKTLARVNTLGPCVKPDVGDVLVMVDGAYLPKDIEYREVLTMLKNAMINSPPAELVFAEGGQNFRREFCRLEGVSMAACLQNQGQICPRTGQPIFLPQRRNYSMHFSGNYGIVIQPFQGRMIVKSKSARRIQEFGEHSKPSVGDVLVAVNGHHFPPGSEYMKVLMTLKSAMMSQEPAELVFEEDLAFQSALKCRAETDAGQQGEAAPPMPVHVQG